jgi:pimeloyl-ACP methyl ester carboxylesterase
VQHIVLVHSPLVGPSTWRFVAAELRNLGASVAVPDLRVGAERGDAFAMVELAIAAVGTSERVTLVAHSGAGILLPLIAARAPSLCTLCFVDAGIPEPEGATTPSRDFLARLRELAVNGVLPKWSSWWGPEVMTTLIPDVHRRTEIESEQPMVPIILYETSIEMPTNWRSNPCSYILLSEGYQGDADLAKTLGWPVVNIPGQHLDIVTNPTETAEEILRVTDRES